MKYATGKYQTAKYGVHVPIYFDEVTAQAPWERPFGSNPTFYIPGRTSAGYPAASQAEISQNREEPYLIELYEPGGELVVPIMRWWNGTLKEIANQPSTLRFTVEYDNPNRVAIVANVDRVIWLRDAYRMVIGRYQVSNIITGHSLDVRTQTFVCQDSLAQLQGEGVNGYTTVTAPDSKTKTVGDIVRELLDLQQRTNTVGFGSVFNGISRLTRELVVSKSTILGALQRLQKMLPLSLQGHMWIDAGGKFQWKSSRGYKAGQTISVGGNMRGVTKDEDRTGLITRVTFLGAGEDEDTQLSVTVTASTSGTWGIRTGPPQEDRRVTHLETLTAMANRFLDEHKNPKYVYTVDVVNLSLADGDRFANWEELYLGSKVRVLSTDVGIDEQVVIESITRNLDNPMRMSVEIGNRNLTMGRILSSIFDRLEERVVINDDGSQNRNMARIYEADDIAGLPGMHAFRNGDLRYTPGPPGILEFYDEDLPGWAQIVGDVAVPQPIEGTTQIEGTSGNRSDASHQHGINTSLAGKNNGTFALTSATELKAKLGGADVSLTRIE